jgi:NAD(P)-dependent dehydrogenase (short-subunit alcohol dehydrogenase family)
MSLCEDDAHVTSPSGGFVSPIVSPFGYRTDAIEVVEGIDLKGKVAIVTGAASGIGVETTAALAAAGALVLMPVRDTAKGAAAARYIATRHPKAALEVTAMDLGDLDSVANFAERFNERYGRCDILINNAGVMATPFEHTAQGHELQLGTNHLGHMALFNGVLPSLRATGGARVVALTSIGHRLSDVDFDDPEFERRAYDPWVAYGQSKTACSLFAVEVTARHRGEGIFANSVHPGGIMTGLQKHMTEEEQRSRGWIDEEGNVSEIFKTVAQGASTSVWAAVGPELDGVGGLYLEDCHEAAPFDKSMPFMGRLDYAVDPVSAARWWELSEQLLARRPD